MWDLHQQTDGEKPQANLVSSVRPVARLRAIWSLLMKSRRHVPTEVEAFSHKDKRVNIPTEELRDFVVKDESQRALVYERDTSLDPQLVWKGKDEQDNSGLTIPLVPIYIQEKIHPRALINVLPRIQENTDDEFSLFSAFNGGPKDFSHKVDFYHYEQNWTNRFILGDSLMVMSSLSGKEGLRGKVQAIYFDPPYGVKFGSNWQVSTRKTEVKDGRVEDASRQPEQVRAFRDTWHLGIHSYLAYLRDRLVSARDLLSDSGSVFIQISDENVHLVRCLLDEVFGTENFVSFITYRVKSPLNVSGLGRLADYIVWYAKSKPLMKYRQLYTPKLVEDQAEFNMLQLADGTAHFHI